MLKIINLVSLITVTILGAILGGEYDNPVHLTALGSLIVYCIVVQVLLERNKDIQSERDKAKDELELTNRKLSELLYQSNQYGENRLYLAVHPLGGGALTNSTPAIIQIIMNAPFGISPPPDIKLLTNENWGALTICGRSVYAREFGARWEYLFSTSMITNLENTSNKFFLAQVGVQFTRSGIYEYTVEAHSKDFQSKISNSFEVA